MSAFIKKLLSPATEDAPSGSLQDLVTAVDLTEIQSITPSTSEELRSAVARVQRQINQRETLLHQAVTDYTQRLTREHDGRFEMARLAQDLQTTFGIESAGHNHPQRLANDFATEPSLLQSALDAASDTLDAYLVQQYNTRTEAEALDHVLYAQSSLTIATHLHLAQLQARLQIENGQGISESLLGGGLARRLLDQKTPRSVTGPGDAVSSLLAYQGRGTNVPSAHTATPQAAMYLPAVRDWSAEDLERVEALYTAEWAAQSDGNAFTYQNYTSGLDDEPTSCRYEASRVLDALHRDSMRKRNVTAISKVLRSDTVDDYNDLTIKRETHAWGGEQMMQTIGHVVAGIQHGIDDASRPLHLGKKQEKQFASLRDKLESLRQNSDQGTEAQVKRAEARAFEAQMLQEVAKAVRGCIDLAADASKLGSLGITMIEGADEQGDD